MRWNFLTAVAATILLCAATGCHVTGSAACPSGNCGGLTGLLSSKMQGEPRGILGLKSKNHRGAQSHLGSVAGPACGPPVAQVTYPYYTTRGPRDFFAANPPSIGP